MDLFMILTEKYQKDESMIGMHFITSLNQSAGIAAILKKTTLFGVEMADDFGRRRWYIGRFAYGQASG